MNMGWSKDGITLPHGTKLRMAFNGQEQYGEIANGNIYVGGQNYNSLSDAARELSGQSMNGWLWWDVKMPDENCWTALRWIKHRKY